MITKVNTGWASLIQKSEKIQNSKLFWVPWHTEPVKLMQLLQTPKNSKSETALVSSISDKGCSRCTDLQTNCFKCFPKNSTYRRKSLANDGFSVFYFNYLRPSEKRPLKRSHLQLHRLEGKAAEREWWLHLRMSLWVVCDWLLFGFFPLLEARNTVTFLKLLVFKFFFYWKWT